MRPRQGIAFGPLSFPLHYGSYSCQKTKDASYKSLLLLKIKHISLAEMQAITLIACNKDLKNYSYYLYF